MKPQFQSKAVTTVRIEPILAMVPTVRERFLQFLTDAKAPAAELQSWKLVFSEMLSNAILHGNRDAQSPAITVQWWCDLSAVWLQVTDRGHGPPPERINNPQLPDDPLASGGRGLFIIHQSTDRFEHWRDPDGFNLRVARHCGSLTPPDVDSEAMIQVLDELSDCYEGLALYDQLTSTLIEGKALDDFTATCIQLLLDAGGYLGAHLECRPGLPIPALKPLHAIPFANHFGATHPDTWQALRSPADYLTWSPAEALSPFSDLKHFARGCAVPICHREVPVAIIAIANARDGRQLLARDLRNLQALADVIGVAVSLRILEREQSTRIRYENALAIATSLQKDLLPIGSAAPTLPNFDLAIKVNPALEVAGDFAELRPTPNPDVFVGCIIDVMGKGVSAAMLGAIFRSHFIDFATSNSSPAAFLSRFNSALSALLSDRVMFITAVAFSLNVTTGDISLCNAGHPPPILLPDNQPLATFDASGPPIGVLPNPRYQDAALNLQPGDRLCCVTDGLFEWRLSNGMLFSWDSLLKWFDAHRHLDSNALWCACQALIAQGDNAFPDDQTFLTLMRTPPNP